MTPEPDTVRQAAQWWVRLRENQHDPKLSQACQRWCEAAPTHQLAWERVNQLSADLGQSLRRTPGARQALEATEQRLSRRRALQLLVGSMGTASAGWWAADQAGWGPWAADFATTTGQQQRFALPNGARLTLNTHSAVDRLRDDELRLSRGELLLESKQPMRVLSGEQWITLKSAQVTVRQEPRYLQLAVIKGEAWLGRLHVGPGQVARASAEHTGLVAPLFDPAGWVDGLIVTRGMPLGAFLDEVARYRSGVVRYAKGVAQLQVSGVYKLADTDRLLELLTQSLPVRIGGLTRWWVSVEAAS
ncbi:MULTISPECIES: DUF4880 domain-containing protein [unclassified Pseudomonas]|uniref:DUF4880 domain-containing protein n=1 Tax=unclassified Pseudomonas TaxID=196821 RepID=UPI000BDD783B|nr:MULTISPECIES: DUF4880 domain-containing protein [unclassified Pseudomonas]PVZ15279.1 FecR family protein [Pseudomonas sp. URIL14HWK12:I12]PVZ24653.1 FecR family protein [Pseudomonas sp. URIL14HWK12:I10]PVZ34498.1 FecR family protein [Pseudomonas sp. URIL14HWK12:I11]SNZ18874.1 FecR family protein [Pseudomonas sp. URIL14HWK12:I9]